MWRAALVTAFSLLLCAAGSPSRPFRMCVLDQKLILQQSRLALAEAAHFQQIRQQAQTNFDNESRNLDADIRALDSLRASLPPAAAKARADDIAKRREALRVRGEQINRNLSQLDAELTSSVSRASAPFVRAIEAERGCSVLAARETLLNVVDPSLDITAEVIARMNAAPAPAAQ